MMNIGKNRTNEQMVPEVFLKKCLSGIYENIGSCRVFAIKDVLDLEYVAKSSQVAVCSSVEQFKNNLENNPKSNLLVSENLINRILLHKFLEETSQSKNILYGDF